MRTIWKFKLPIVQFSIDLRMPQAAELLSVQLSADGIVYVWALVESDSAIVRRRMYIVGTGHAAPPEVRSARHVGTVQDRCFVWHIFDGGEVAR